jgi:integrase/recombinase XerD
MAEISPLRRRMIEDMTIRNLSPATQQIVPQRGIEVEPVFWPLS